MIRIELLNRGQSRPHMHTDVELAYILEGRAQVEINDKLYVLEKNGMIIVNSNNRHQIFEDSKNHDKKLWLCSIMLDYSELLEDLSKDFALFWCNSAVNDSGEYKILSGILDEILDSYEVSEAGNYMKKSLYYKLVGCLAEHFLVTGMSDQWSRKSNFEKEEMLQYMNANYFRPVTLKEMADKVYMSETAFSKYFKKIAGMNFVQYKNNIRLHHAVEDLLYSDKQMTRIAVDNGFSSPSFFNRVFKSVYHETPTEFREKAGIHSDQETEKKPEGYREFVASYLENKSSEKDGEAEECYVYAAMDQYQSYRKIWTQGVNLGDAAAILAARTQDQIRFVHGNIHFKYGRVCNLLGWDMKLRESHSFAALKFDDVDMVLDFLADEDIIPIIDLGDKPKHTLRDFDQVIYMEPRKKVYETLDEYKKVLEMFMSHVIRRYGEAWVNQWIFDVWFDPGEAYQNSVVIRMEDYDYTEVFEATAKIIKSFGKNIRVGGTGFVIGNMHRPVIHFLEKYKNLSNPPDFLSTYWFPYGHIDENDVLGSAISPHTEFVSRERERYKSFIKQYSLENVPLYVMEWNMSLSQRSFYNDGCGKGALMLKNMTENLECAHMCVYNLLSDEGADYYDLDQMLIGAAGLLTKEGIAKPCYYALLFMSWLESYVVEMGDGYIITTNRSGIYKILCFNYKAIGQVFYLRRESEFNINDLKDIYVDNREKTFHFSMSPVSSGTWRLHRYRVYPQYGSVLGIWEQLGQDTSVREDVEYMRRVCTPRIEGEKIQCQGSAMNLTETLQAHEMRMIVLSR
ncbi:helix-turn-helix domain-containing protein [Catenibacillus scindens]|uniref:GH39 family glycosyl hydrolase n=1 Tax=Catenibacillus scindens TaxID=673271 RepID=UPI00320A5E4D